MLLSYGVTAVIVEKMRDAIDMVMHKSGAYPTSIIVGVDVVGSIDFHFSDAYIRRAVSPMRDRLCMFGIPLTIDYSHPTHVEVCEGIIVNTDI